jgi:hypothetical protein
MGRRFAAGRPRAQDPRRGAVSRGLPTITHSVEFHFPPKTIFVTLQSSTSVSPADTDLHMGTSRVRRWSDWASEHTSIFLSHHRVSSLVVTAALMFITADAGRRVFEGEASHASFLTWVALALMAWTPVAMVLVSRLVSPGFPLSIAWAMALAPFLAGFAAVAARSPVSVMWLGFGLSLVLLAWAARTGLPSRR